MAGPIEQEVNGVEGMVYMQSTAANDGSYSLTVTFDYGIDPDHRPGQRAKSGQPGRTAAAAGTVTRQGMRVKKRSTDMLMVINLYSPDASLTPEFISNYTSINIADDLDAY